MHEWEWFCLTLNRFQMHFRYEAYDTSITHLEFNWCQSIKHISLGMTVMLKINITNCLKKISANNCPFFEEKTLFTKFLVSTFEGPRVSWGLTSKENVIPYKGSFFAVTHQCSGDQIIFKALLLVENFNFSTFS